MGFARNNVTGYVRPVMILTADTTVSVTCSLLAILLMRWLTGPISHLDYYILIYIGFALFASIVGFLIIGSHKVVLRHTTARNMGGVATAVFLKEVVLIICLLLNLFNIKEATYGITLVVMDSSMTMCALVLMRVFTILITQNRGTSMEEEIKRLSVLVYGTSPKSAALVARLEFSPHYNVVGFIGENTAMGDLIICNKKVYFCKDLEHFKEVMASLGGVDCVLFARQEDAENSHGEKVLHWCIESGTHMLVTPKVEEIKTSKVSARSVESIKIDSTYIADGMSAFERNVKRIVDLCAAAVLIVFFSPLMLICYIAIKIEDHGPALYRQERIGRFGRPFEILKFRSMRMDAEKFGPALYSGNDDPRLTKVGKFLRQHHLDELPQLFNVFKGDMAFIGYRPERQFYIDQIVEQDPRYTYLYQIRPGVTSYATLYNGYTDTLDKMLRRLQYDLYYLKNRSWWFDIKVLWLTFVNIIFGKKF